jgi:nitrogen fixation NifU-like protein
MADLRELYLEMVTDHARKPRHRGTVDPYNHIGHGNNPLCGDVVVVTLSLDGDTIKEVKFDGEGCAISTASADLMADAIQGKTIEEAKELFREFHACITEDGSAEGLGKLAVFEGVREFPLRVKCATLVWHTLIAALDDSKEVSTE